MPKGGTRRAQQRQRSGHVDKYANLAARSQAEREALNAQWERDHPATDSVAAPADTTEDEEAE